MNVQIHKEELVYYTHITAPAYGEEDGVIMEQDCFFLHRHLSPTPSAEIGELKYFSLDNYLQEPCRAPGAIMILEKLKADRYIA